MLEGEDVEEHALGDGGNEAPDVVLADQHRHGLDVGPGGGAADVAAVEFLGGGDFGGAIEGVAAAFYGKKRGPIGAFVSGRRHGSLLCFLLCAFRNLSPKGWRELEEIYFQLGYGYDFIEFDGWLRGFST